MIQKSHSTMSCLKVNITRRGDEDFKITEYRRFGLLQKAVDHTLIDVGVLKIPDPTEPAKMNVKFSLSKYTNIMYTQSPETFLPLRTLFVSIIIYHILLLLLSKQHIVCFDANINQSI